MECTCPCLAATKVHQFPQSTSKSSWISLSIVFLILAVVLSAGGIWAWCLYLERRPSPEPVRNILLGVLAMATVAEYSLIYLDLLHWWMAIVLFICNFWGFLDALLRFPVLHDFDTAFSVKQVVLLCAKMASLALGFTSFRDYQVWFFFALGFNVVTLPLLYLLALPIDEGEQEQRLFSSGVVDVDIAWRLCELVGNRQKQRECMLGCTCRLRLASCWIASKNPAASALLVRFKPSYSHALRKGRQV